MKEIQERMFADRQNLALYNKVIAYGFDYLKKLPKRNVYPTTQALENLKDFDEPMPQSSAEAFEVLDLLQKSGAPATVAMNGSRYFGFVIGSAVPAGMSAKLLATFWDQNTGMFVASPIAGKLELVVEEWLRSIFHLPEGTVAGFVSGTSLANLCGLIAGRYRLLKNQGWDVNQKGLAGAPPIRIIAGREAHSTIMKTIAILGLGLENIHLVDSDEEGRIIPSRIPELDNSTLLILQAGNVHSGAFDDFAAITKKAKQAGAWIHIDGAFGLWAAACDSLAHATKGIEYADSWAVDGHKTLNTPYDSGIALCADKEALASALHLSGGYLILNEERDGMFFTPDMSRRARVIELWATMKYLGLEGIDQIVLNMHERARQFEKELSALEGFSVLNEVAFNQVVVACDTDLLTEEVLREIQEERICWVGGSTWQNRKVIRISVCSWATTEEDVRMSVASFRSSLEKVRVKNSSLVH